MRMKLSIVLLLAVSAVTSLSAHVMVSPPQSTAGAVQKYELRVHNEAKAAATAIDLDVPDGVPILKLEEDVVHDQNVSNRLALVPSKSAVPLLLKHAGFREVFWIKPASSDLPLDYVTGARMTFIAVK